MPWLIGIDEAGYGPNLGPFVMSAVACRVDAATPSCLWDALQSAVRRAGGKRDPRIVIDDSKKVYGSGKTLAGLERGVLALLDQRPTTLAEFVRLLTDETQFSELASERWWRGTTTIPTEVTADEADDCYRSLHSASEQAGVREWRIVAGVVCPRRFNRITARAGTKSVVLADGFVRLVQTLFDSTQDNLDVKADKQGGRNTYRLQVQQAVGGLVRTVEENEERSRYETAVNGRVVTVTIEPRADASNLCVAWASMVSKYVRELCMREFNAFWANHLPNLTPTAGYPGDAPRFLASIQEKAVELGLTREELWREK